MRNFDNRKTPFRNSVGNVIDKFKSTGSVLNKKEMTAFVRIITDISENVEEIVPHQFIIVVNDKAFSKAFFDAF